MEPVEPRNSVIRATTPPRNGQEQEARAVLWLMSKPGAEGVRADLVALTDAVELELIVGGKSRRVMRFFRDGAARRHAARVRDRLAARGFADRRGRNRTSAWLE